MRNHRIGGHLHPQMVRYGIPWPIPPVFSEASRSKMKPAAMLNSFQRFRVVQSSNLGNPWEP